MTKRIIVADDEDTGMICQMFLQFSCNEQGIDVQVDLVKSGEELVEKVRNNHYDLILSDNYMGNLSGAEALKQIRNDNPDATLCLMSSREDVEDKAKEAGATDFMIKDPLLIQSNIDKIVRKYLL